MDTPSTNTGFPTIAEITPATTDASLHVEANGVKASWWSFGVPSTAAVKLSDWALYANWEGFRSPESSADQPAQLPNLLYGVLLTASSSKYVARCTISLVSLADTLLSRDCSSFVQISTSVSVGLQVGTAVGDLE
jgi:hypothetical protein